MLANWIKESVNSAPGTGTISLGGAETGFVAFGDQLADGDVVHYSVVDGNDREAGVGTFNTGSPNTISRDRILETLSGGTFDNSAPTALDLSASTIVSIAPISQRFINANIGSNSVIDATGAQYFAPANVQEANGVSGQSADTLIVYPALILAPIVINTITFQVTTAATTANLRFGIYAPDGSDGSPNALLKDFGDVSADSSTTGFKTSAVSGGFYLPAGLYWFGGVCDVASATFQVQAPENKPSGFLGVGLSPLNRFDNNRPRCYERTTSVTGALPSTMGAVSNTGLSPLFFGWQ